MLPSTYVTGSVPATPADFRRLLFHYVGTDLAPAYTVVVEGYAVFSWEQIDQAFRSFVEHLRSLVRQALELKFFEEARHIGSVLLLAVTSDIRRKTDVEALLAARQAYASKMHHPDTGRILNIVA